MLPIDGSVSTVYGIQHTCIYTLLRQLSSLDILCVYVLCLVCLCDVLCFCACCPVYLCVVCCMYLCVMQNVYLSLMCTVYLCVRRCVMCCMYLCVCCGFLRAPSPSGIKQVPHTGSGGTTTHRRTDITRRLACQKKNPTQEDPN